MMMPIAEMREFAGFAPAEQRYIKRSLDIGLARTDAFRRWGRSEAENTAIRRQYVAYQDLKALRALIPAARSFATAARRRLGCGARGSTVIATLGSSEVIESITAASPFAAIGPSRSMSRVTRWTSRTRAAMRCAARSTA